MTCLYLSWRRGVMCRQLVEYVHCTLVFTGQDDLPITVMKVRSDVQAAIRVCTLYTSLYYWTGWLYSVYTSLFWKGWPAYTCHEGEEWCAGSQAQQKVHREYHAQCKVQLKQVHSITLYLSWRFSLYSRTLNPRKSGVSHCTHYY